MSNGPKKLFADEDTATKIEEIKQQEENQKFKTTGPKPLTFPDHPIIPPHLNQTPHAPPTPVALFDTKPVPYVSAAVKLATEKFANLGTGLESVERQIKMLLPLNITTVVTWGEPSISQEADLVTKAAGLLKMFSELRGNELCESALKASTQTQTGHFWPFGSGHSVIGYKPNLSALKTQLISMLPQCDDFTSKIDVLHTKLAINLAALSSACDAVGTIEDSSLSMAVDNRRRILAQCVQQSDLTTQQLKAAKTLMVQQMSQLSQLLDVTIPAFETANATR